jgi:hypothetical protein
LLNHFQRSLVELQADRDLILHMLKEAYRFYWTTSYGSPIRCLLVACFVLGV